MKILHFPNIANLFLFAKSSGLSYPKVHMILPEGDIHFRLISDLVKVNCYIAGRLIGSFNFPLNEESKFEANTIKTWYAQYTKFPEWAKSAIDRLEDDPRNLALLQGTQTNTCMFCRKELTDARSVYFGYGPVCAENWGLEYRLTDEAAGEILKLEFKLLTAQMKAYEEGLKSSAKPPKLNLKQKNYNSEEE